MVRLFRHFFYTALVCIPFIIEAADTIVTGGVKFDHISPVVDYLLEGKQLTNIGGLPNMLHDIVHLLIQDLHSQNLTSQADQLLYAERVLNSIDLDSTIQVQSTSCNAESYSHFELHEIKF